MLLMDDGHYIVTILIIKGHNNVVAHGMALDLITIFAL